MNRWPYLLRSWSLPENVLADICVSRGSLLGLRPLSSLSLWVTRVLPLCSPNDSQTDMIHSVLAWNISGTESSVFLLFLPFVSYEQHPKLCSSQQQWYCFLFPFRSMEYVSAWHMEAWVSYPSKQVALHHPHTTCLVDKVSCLANTSIPLGEVVPVFLCLT